MDERPSHFSKQIRTLALIAALTVSGVFVYGVPACATESATPPEDCRILPQDPWEPNAKLGSGPHTGLCVDTANIRSFRRLSLTEVAKVSALGGYDVTKYEFFANVQHLNKFWIAAIPKTNRISRIIFQAEHFPPEAIAAHTQLRIDFYPGREPMLHLQTDLTLPPVKIDSLVVSNEAAKVRGGPDFNLINGLEGYFAFGKRIVSLQDEVARIKAIHHWTEQYELRFPSDQRRDDILFFALDYFADPEMKSIYNTLEHNCSNSLYEAFDLFAGRPRREWDRAQTTLPLAYPWSLRKRGMIDDHSELKSLNDEFGFPR
jgi:hypothetical protein